MANYYPATPYPMPFFDPDTGELLSGGSLEAYRAQSSTPVDMYSDKDGTSAGDTITLNAGGYPQVSGTVIVIHLAASVEYKFILKDSAGNQIWSADDISNLFQQVPFRRTVATVADLKADASVVAGNIVATSEYATGHGYDSGNTYLARAVTAGTDDGGSLIKSTGNTDIEFVGMFPDGVNVKQFGAHTDGTDYSTKIANALNYATRVEVPENSIFVCKNLPAPDNTTVVLHGTLKLPNSVNDQDAIFKDATAVDGFRIEGGGTLDGNRANQSGTISTEAVRLEAASNVVIDDLTVTSFYGHDSAAQTANVIHISGGDYNRVTNIKLFDWSQEGIVLENTDHSIVANVEAADNHASPASWSAIQVGGTTSKYNIIANVTTYNTGASAVGMDSQYSAMSNITVDTVRFQNGVNLGHSGKVSSYSTVTNVTVRNIEDPSNVNSAGISVANGSKYITISNYVVETSTQRGVNISSGAQNVKLVNGHILNAATAINVFQAGTVDIANLELTGCTNGLNKDAATIMRLSNVDLTGATNRISSSSSNIESTNLTMDNTAARSGGGSIEALGAGGTVTVTNANARSFSRIVLEPSNDAGAATLAYIKTYNDGSFVIQTPNNGAAGAFVRWQIV